MQTGALLAIVGVLAAALAAGVAALIMSGDAQRLRTRVRDLAGTGDPAAAMAAAIPSIRVESGSASPLLTGLCRFFRFNPEIPQEQVISWPFVVMGGLAVAGVTAFQLREALGAPWSLLAGLLLGAFLVRAFFSWQHGRYRDKVLEQIPDAIGLLVRAVRAGLPMAEALRSVSREIASPTREEFGRVVGDVAIGRPLEVALMRVHERTQLTEYAFLAITLGLQAQTGGSLAETLENLADMVRRRVALAKRARALAAEGRMQAGILAVLPFIAAAGMSALQPFYVAQFTENPTGRKMAMVGLGLMVTGLLTIRWLIRRAGRD